MASADSGNQGRTVVCSPSHRDPWAKIGDNGSTAFAVEFWAEILRVLKPGGHVAAFGGNAVLSSAKGALSKTLGLRSCDRIFCEVFWDRISEVT